MRTPHCALEVCEECEVRFVLTCAKNCDQGAGCHLVSAEEPRRALVVVFLAVDEGTNGGANVSQGGRRWMGTPK